MRRVLLVAVLAALLVAPVARAWTWPVGGPVLQPFSFDPAHPYAAGEHRGVDIAADAGEAVLAPAAGTVTFSGTVPGSGRALTITTGDGLAVTLTHLGSIVVAAGAAVAEGQPVGTVGPSGDPEVVGPYLHLGRPRRRGGAGLRRPTLVPAGARKRSCRPVAAPAPAPVPAPVAAPPAPSVRRRRRRPQRRRCPWPSRARRRPRPNRNRLRARPSPIRRPPPAQAGSAFARWSTGAGSRRARPRSRASCVPGLRSRSRTARVCRRLRRLPRASTRRRVRQLAGVVRSQPQGRAELGRRSRREGGRRATRRRHPAAARPRRPRPGRRGASAVSARARAARRLSCSEPAPSQAAQKLARIIGRHGDGQEEDPRGAGVALCVGLPAPGARGGVRAVRRVRALSPAQGQRRAGGERYRRARDAGDGGRRRGREVLP